MPDPISPPPWLRPADVLVLLAALVTAFWTMSALWSGDAKGRYVRVRGPELERILPLDHDRELEVRGPLGISRLRIADGKIRFLSSPCPNQVCVHTGAIGRAGETAVCLPNGVSAEVIARGPGFDSINY